MSTRKIQTASARGRWFSDGRFGTFIHFGPYAAWGRGEQVLFREHLNQKEYAARAARWNPRHFDPAAWARVIKEAGCTYAVFTTRHHDGYCLWDSKLTDYTSARLAPRRDLVADYVRAFRRAGLRVGLYYSLADWRIPAYWVGPAGDPRGWRRFRAYVHGQIRELLTGYGTIDVLWFDGSWPHHAAAWQSAALLRTIRRLQPGILVNRRLGIPHKAGDFGTPEHAITPRPGLWESCQVTTWRLWGYSRGERWRSTDVLLDFLTQAASQGGNLLLNVGPRPDGRLPAPYLRRMRELGAWMRRHGEAIHGSEPGEVCEFITYGRQIRKGRNLYLVIRFWDGRGVIHMAGLKTRVISALLLTTGRKVPFRQEGDHLSLTGLPKRSPTRLFPVIKLVCASRPQPASWAAQRLWDGDPARMLPWARSRGEGVLLDGRWS